MREGARVRARAPAWHASLTMGSAVGSGLAPGSSQSHDAMTFQPSIGLELKDAMSSKTGAADAHDARPASRTGAADAPDARLGLPD